MSDKTEHPPIPQAFEALGVRSSILRQLAELAFNEPSEIQKLVIPRALEGVDILGQARTGTGKTAAFGIPLLQRAQRGVASQALILVPTRELAVQVESEIVRIGAQTPIRTLAVYGGQKISAQAKRLQHGPEIIVGTPGRVMDLLQRRLLSLENMRFVVLDEVDRMLDIGFRDDIRDILRQIRDAVGRAEQRNRASRMEERQGGEEPDERQERVEESGDEGEVNEGGGVSVGGRGSSKLVQTIFVSATISPEIERLARSYMREPVEKLIAPGADDKPTVEKVEQYCLTVQPWDKYRLLRMLLEKESPELAIVFCRTKHGAEKLARQLTADGIDCREIHGNLKQNKRDKVMKNFRTGKFDVLVATDLASRGIDVQDITHIINYDLPEDPEVYVHRIGRTARMGAQGKAFTFVTRQQGAELTRVENLINMIVPTLKLEGFEERPDRDGGLGLRPADEGGGGAAAAGGATRNSATDTGATQGAGASGGQVAKPAAAKAPLTIGSKIRRMRRR